MQEVIRTIEQKTYVSNDGKEFSTEEACRIHEQEILNFESLNKRKNEITLKSFDPLFYSDPELTYYIVDIHDSSDVQVILDYYKAMNYYSGCIYEEIAPGKYILAVEYNTFDFLPLSSFRNDVKYIESILDSVIDE